MDEQAKWSALDDYVEGHLVGIDRDLDGALTRSAAAGLPAINVSPSQGKMLHILARTVSARRILEVGTLGGYSTIWLARALPADGALISLELNPATAEVARQNLADAGLADCVEVRVGPAIDTLPAITGPFDFVFIDANKDQNPEYFARALDLTRPGGLIVVDNVIRNGSILDAETSDPYVRGVRRLFEVMANEPRVTVTAVQTVGGKGHDGFALAFVN